MKKVHYEVNSIQNSQMKTQVKNALNKLEGVQSVNVDLQRGTVEVGFNNKASEDTIRDCIEQVGCKID